MRKRPQTHSNNTFPFPNLAVGSSHVIAPLNLGDIVVLDSPTPLAIGGLDATAVAASLVDGLADTSVVGIALGPGPLQDKMQVNAIKVPSRRRLGRTWVRNPVHRGRVLGVAAVEIGGVSVAATLGADVLLFMITVVVSIHPSIDHRPKRGGGRLAEA